MKVEVLGPGCPRCNRTHRLIRDTAHEMGKDIDLEHITDIKDISQRGVFHTPAVVLEGEVISEGDVPTTEQVQNWLEAI